MNVTEFDGWKQIEHSTPRQPFFISFQSSTGTVVRNNQFTCQQYSYLWHPRFGVVVQLDKAGVVFDKTPLCLQLQTEIMERCGLGAGSAQPCMQPVGLTTCGYPQTHEIHNNKGSMSFHEFVSAAGSAAPATPEKCPTCGSEMRNIPLSIPRKGYIPVGEFKDKYCDDPWHSGAAPATKPLDAPTMADAAEMLWVVLASVSGGDWSKQSQEWQEAAARWRNYYFDALDAHRVEARIAAEAERGKDK